MTHNSSCSEGGQEVRLDKAVLVCLSVLIARKGPDSTYKVEIRSSLRSEDTRNELPLPASRAKPGKMFEQFLPSGPLGNQLDAVLPLSPCFSPQIWPPSEIL